MSRKSLASGSLRGWEPVLRKRTCSNRRIERDDDAKTNLSRSHRYAPAVSSLCWRSRRAARVSANRNRTKLSGSTRARDRGVCSRRPHRRVRAAHGAEIGENLGGQFYVDNITGGTGNIATGQAAKATPDGYTVYFAFSSYVVNPTLFDRVPYDPYKDFDPVTLAVSSTTVLSVNPSVPAKTVSELVALIRAGGSKYSFATGGTGSQTHLAGEQFRLALNLDLVHVPFNSGGPAVAAVVAGHAPIGFNALTPAVPQIKDGRVGALAVTSKTRSQILPEVPTMTEA